MGASFLGDVNALESFASRIGGYHPDQVITHSGDDNQYSPCVGFADLGNALLSAPCLKLEIDGGSLRITCSASAGAIPCSAIWSMLPVSQSNICGLLQMAGAAFTVGNS
jgi:hypothetical protein